MSASVPGLLAVDGARAALLRSLGAPGRALLRDPSLRVALYGLVGLGLALALTCAAPLHTFAIAPLVLGVPHLLVDLRYLVVRPGLHRRPGLVLAAGAPLLLAAVVHHPAVGLLSPVAVALLARGSFARRAVVASVAVTLVALAALQPENAVLAFVHGHNVVGAVFVLAVFSRKRWLEAIPVAAFAAVALALALGAFDGALLRPFALEAPASAEPLDLTLARMAPTSDPVLAVRLLALFVFAQGVHYVAWLRLVPELARERRGIRSFSSSARHLAIDLGPACLLLAAGALVVLAIVARTRSLSEARDLYLTMAAFHGPLELAALALVAVEGRASLAPRSARAC
jgi:hypothetical protein